jgi:hypothetical protein
MAGNSLLDVAQRCMPFQRVPSLSPDDDAVGLFGGRYRVMSLIDIRTRFIDVQMAALKVGFYIDL